jgi:hypothetical protein
MSNYMRTAVSFRRSARPRLWRRRPGGWTASGSLALIAPRRYDATPNYSSPSSG